MARKRHTAEEIVARLRQVDVLTSQGRPVADAVRAIGVSEVTYYRWRSEYGGLKGDQVKRLKALEAENARLRRAVSDLTLEKVILAEAARGNFQAPPAGALAWSMWLPRSVCPRDGLAGFSASTAPRSASRQSRPTTRRGSPPISSRWPPDMAATATAGSRRCCGMQAGRSTASEWNGSGGGRG